MRVQRLRIENYKGLNDSGWMEFGPGFNIFVGQNNAGKTAILEGFRFGEAGNRPHKSIDIPAGAPLIPQSIFSVDLVVQGPDIRYAFFTQGAPGYFPVPSSTEPVEYVEQIFAAPAITLQLKAFGGTSFMSRSWPSHGLFSNSPVTRARKRHSIA
jgi:hypothetical protein